MSKQRVRLTKKDLQRKRPTNKNVPEVVREANKKLASSPSPNKDAVTTAVVISNLEAKTISPIRKLAKYESVENQDDYNAVADLIKSLKNIDDEATKEEDYLAEGNRKIIKEAKANLKKITVHFKPFHDKIATLETKYKLMLSTFYEKNLKQLQKVDEDFKVGKIKNISTYAAKVENLSISNKGSAKVRKVWKVFVNDKMKIPREYMDPNLNAIEQSFKDGVPVPGCEYKQVPNIAI